jgi:hypothetical protein
LRKANELNVPLVTHAEDSSLKNSFHLLMHGQVILSDTSTLLGNIGYRYTPWMLKDFIEKYDMNIKYVHKGENKIRFNKFKELR